MAQDTARFCTDTLCEPELVAFLNAQFVCWGGDVRSTDAFRVRGSPDWLHAYLGTAHDTAIVMR